MISGRLEEYADVERAIGGPEVDTVFHLGAQAIVGTALRSPVATFETNIRGTITCSMLVAYTVIRSSAS